MAQIDAFLKLDGIEGESQDSKHKGEIDVYGYSVGAIQGGTMDTGGGGGSGRAQFQDLSFMMKTQKATPKLLEAVATGKHIGNAVLTCRKAGGDQQEYLKIELGDVIVTSYHHALSSDAAGLDQCSLNYAKIQFEYKEQKPDGTLGGSVKAGYNDKENKKI